MRKYGNELNTDTGYIPMIDIFYILSVRYIDEAQLVFAPHVVNLPLVTRLKLLRPEATHPPTIIHTYLVTLKCDYTVISNSI